MGQELDPRSVGKMRRALAEICAALIREAAYWAPLQNEYASELVRAAHDIQMLEQRFEALEQVARRRLLLEEE